MDRRQKKTRAAVFDAFLKLLASKSYSQITVQEIIDKANVGRSTFYAHFETRDELLKALCLQLFDHVLESSTEESQIRFLSHEGIDQSVIEHLFWHIEKNDTHILDLLSAPDSELFASFFKQSLSEMMDDWLFEFKTGRDMPRAFVINYLACTFIDTLMWWTRNGRKQSPRQLSDWFEALVGPVLSAIEISDDKTVLK